MRSTSIPDLCCSKHIVNGPHLTTLCLSRPLYILRNGLPDLAKAKTLSSARARVMKFATYLFSCIYCCCCLRLLRQSSDTLVPTLHRHNLLCKQLYIQDRDKCMKCPSYGPDNRDTLFAHSQAMLFRVTLESLAQFQGHHMHLEDVYRSNKQHRYCCSCFEVRP